MAIVRHLEQLQLQNVASHTDTECTYCIVEDDEGNRFLQIDTYGSPERKLFGKKSQSIRFASSAARELRVILDRHFR